MKKIIASLLSAVLTLSVAASVSAVTTVNPWKDSSMHIMEIENYDSGYPTGDISTFPNFWSYNKEIGFAPAGGTLKNGQLGFNSTVQTAFSSNVRKALLVLPCSKKQKESVFISKTEPNLRLDAAFTASVIKIKWIRARQCSSSMEHPLCL